MKKHFYTLFIAFFSFGFLNAQENQQTDSFKPHGNAFGKVFWNYHYSFDGNQKSSFEIQRAYLGYKFNFSENISTKITIDGARVTEASPFTVVLKHAQLDWQVATPLTLSLGLMGLTQFDTQEKFWGYRYIYKSFQDEFALGTSADLGVNANLQLTDWLEADLFMLNGEGYTRLQDDFGMHKFGGDLVAEPVDGLILKAYYNLNFKKYDKYGNDSIIADTTAIQNLAFFAGYQAEKFRVGAEYNLMLNGTKYYVASEDHNLTGISVYATYLINKKFEVFGNYINFMSNTLAGQSESWNYSKDGNIIIAGMQYVPVKGVKMALNYRAYLYKDPDIQDDNRIYVNFEFSF
jgi:hypothetical protein